MLGHEEKVAPKLLVRTGRSLDRMPRDFGRDSDAPNKLEVNITQPPLFSSCSNAYEAGVREDGWQRLPFGYHFCIMTLIGNCGEGGWTLALGSDGSKKTCV